MAQEGSERDGDLPQWVATVLDEIEDHTVMPDVVSVDHAAVLTSLARTMARAGADAEPIVAALRVMNRTRCRPPLNDEALEGIAYDVVAGRS